MTGANNPPRNPVARRGRGRRQAGFGLLEAIVALTLFASAGMTLFG